MLFGAGRLFRGGLAFLGRRVRPGGWALCAVLAAGPAFAQACLRQKLAEAPLRDDDGFISMPVAIDGRAASLLVDTGSDTGLLTEAAAAGLGLERDPDRQMLLRGTGGIGRRVPNVVLPSLAIGGMRLAGSSVPVGTLPAMPVVEPPVAGLLGADVLSRFDLELDLPHRRIGFWRIGTGSIACAPPPGRDGSFDAIALRRDGDRLELDARLDGKPISVLVDTGARSRILSTTAARRLGVDGDRLGADPGGVNAGIDLHPTEYHWHRFRQLVIGTETTRDPVLTVAPLAEPVDLLLGADWFATREVWISYATNTLFVRKAATWHGPDHGADHGAP